MPNYKLCNTITNFPPLLKLCSKLCSAYSSSSSQILTRAKNSELDHHHSSREQKYLFLFKKCSTLREIEQLHSQIIQSGLNHSLFLIGKIISFCSVSEQGMMSYAVSVFENSETKDGFLWNTMIRGFVRSGEVETAIGHYRRMQQDCVVADSFTFSFLLKMCGESGDEVLGKQLHCSVVKFGLQRHGFVLNTLIHMYGMLKRIDVAHHLFDEIPEPELVNWNTIIDCHVNSGECSKALSLFERMQKCNVRFSEATLVVTLSACSEIGALDFGRWLHFLGDKSGLSGTTQLCNSLIDMYSKCGEVGEAWRVFERMKVRNTITWNTMILGYAIHGNAREALELFTRMMNEGQCAPDDVTFLGALCACSHGGMVKEGRRCFHSMINDFCFQPTIKHYGCMVDILGRAGFVQEAYDLIMSIPEKCNAIIWRTLLSACCVHGNVELTERVRSRLLEVEPDHSSNFVLVSNTYAYAGLWNDLVRAKKRMNKRGVQKPTPGYSLIEFTPENSQSLVQ